MNGKFGKFKIILKWFLNIFSGCILSWPFLLNQFFFLMYNDKVAVLKIYLFIQ